jgi:hypothetical protein
MGETLTLYRPRANFATQNLEKISEMARTTIGTDFEGYNIHFLTVP